MLNIYIDIDAAERKLILTWDYLAASLQMDCLFNCTVCKCNHQVTFSRSVVAGIRSDTH